jgi:catechol 2,3-dioxygenase-like lactoylglutathione lyase family enzyme
MRSYRAVGVDGVMHGPLDNGYDEAVCVVADAATTAQRLGAVLGYRVERSGSLHASFLALHGIAPDSGWTSLTIAQPQAGRGRMRLLQPPGPVPPVRRMGARPWDVGGFFDLSLRSLGPIDELLGAFCRNGFVAHAPVTRFAMGGTTVLEALAQDGDGLCFAMVERLSPPLTGWEHIAGAAGNPFNSVITVDDIDAGRRFVTDVLGWQLLVDTALSHQGGYNVMGMPIDLARAHDVHVGIAQAQGRMEGSLELISYPCEPLDFRSDKPGWRGIASLCFPVSDLAAVLGRAQECGAATGAARTVHWDAQGTQVQAGWIMTPWAARLVFYEGQA